MTTSADQEAGPHPDMDDYASYRDYVIAWHTWRSIRWDWVIPKACADHKVRLIGARFGLPADLIEDVIGKG